ncbi:unnamed protein product [Parascedosporium putredinis]|uniref:Uncharacterized protein n=1 Tax=Parascedosporium putredinis TaxID=1442378 RepID=A0A9P1GVB0_9PEZI|nr:unnamed protein product [Parascedosporium putredinis]CAI7988008.1 unnamed protein product [Parascedosporium putredinis]
MSRPFANAAARRVPTVSEVVAGARVNIVLKADQPTGRTVAGTPQRRRLRPQQPEMRKVSWTLFCARRVVDQASGCDGKVAAGAAMTGTKGRRGRKSG